MKRIITSLAVVCMYVCITSTLAHTKVAFADLKDGLVAYYPFNGNANDESGNGNNGTIYGATLTTDRLGNTNKAYSFDGVDDYITVSNANDLNLKNFTISFWMKPAVWRDSSGDGSRGIISKKNDDNSYGFVIYNDGYYPKEINFRMKGTTSTANYLYSTSYVEIGAWQHWMVSYNSSEVRWYKNGTLDKIYSSILVGDMSNTINLHIGHSHTWNGYYEGVLDEIRIYNRVLSDSEIQELYNEGSSTTPTPTATLVQTPTPTPTVTETVTPTPTPSETGIVFGYVYDEDENPLRSITVKIDGDAYSDSATTDEDGYYEFNKVPDGDYTITYSKTGYVTQTAEATVEDGDKVGLDTVVMQVAQKGSIYGYVVDIKGDPIESVRLTLKGIGIKVKKTASTDSDGFFEFKDLETGIYRIVAKKRFYKAAQQTVELEEGEDKEIEIEMKKTSKRIKLEGVLD